MCSKKEHYADMTELADVGDSNSPDISRKGSNPFIRIQADIL